MLLRIYHFFLGHNNIVRTWISRSPATCPYLTIDVSSTNVESHRYERYGFTTYYSLCNCGKLLKIRIIGLVPKKDEIHDSELQALRKMAGLGE